MLSDNTSARALSRAVLLIPLLLGCADRSPPPPADASPRWRAAVTSYMGGASDTSAALDWIGSVARLNPDILLATQPRLGEVLAIDLERGRTRRIAGRGGGPRETMSPRAVKLVDDTAWISDGGSFVLLSREGRVLDTRDPFAGRLDRSESARIEAGWYVGSGRYITAPAMSNSAPPATHSPVFVEMPHQATRDTIARLNRENRRLVIRDPDTPTPGISGPQPFADDDMMDYDAANRLLVVAKRADAPKLIWLSLTGDTVAIHRYRYIGGAVPESRVDTVMASLVKMIRGSHSLSHGSESEARGWVHQALYIPARLPAMSVLTVASDGTVWTRTGCCRWVAYTVDGHAGDVDLPARMEILESRGDTIWGMTRDEWDVPVLIEAELRTR